MSKPRRAPKPITADLARARAYVRLALTRRLAPMADEMIEAVDELNPTPDAYTYMLAGPVDELLEWFKGSPL